MTNNKVILTIEGYLKPKTYIENGKKRAAIEILTDEIDFVLRSCPNSKKAYCSMRENYKKG